MLLIAHNATVKCILHNTLFWLIKSSILSIVEKLEFNKKVPPLTNLGFEKVTNKCRKENPTIPLLLSDWHLNLLFYPSYHQNQCYPDKSFFLSTPSHHNLNFLLQVSFQSRAADTTNLWNKIKMECNWPMVLTISNSQFILSLLMQNITINNHSCDENVKATHIHLNARCIKIENFGVEVEFSINREFNVFCFAKTMLFTLEKE